MPDRTVNEITDAAYLKNKIKNPSTLQDTEALSEFQDMLASWSIDSFLVPYYTSENFTLVVGQSVYTIGVTGDSPDFVTATGRPTKIISAFIRVSGTDDAIDVDMKEREYNEIRIKSTQVKPTRLYYDPQYPIGSIKFNSAADLTHDFHLISEKALEDVAALTVTLNLPKGINEALIYNLAVRLAINLGNKPNQELNRIAKSSMERLQLHNSIDKIQNPVTLDSALTSGVQR